MINIMVKKWENYDLNLSEFNFIVRFFVLVDTCGFLIKKIIVLTFLLLLLNIFIILVLIY